MTLKFPILARLAAQGASGACLSPHCASALVTNVCSSNLSSYRGWFLCGCLGSHTRATSRLSRAVSRTHDHYSLIYSIYLTPDKQPVLTLTSHFPSHRLNQLSVSVELPILSTSCKCNQSIFIFCVLLL